MTIGTVAVYSIFEAVGTNIKIRQETGSWGEILRIWRMEPCFYIVLSEYNAVNIPVERHYS